MFLYQSRPFVALVLAVLLGAALIGCGGEANTPTPNAVPTNVPIPTTAVAAPTIPAPTTTAPMAESDAPAATASPGQSGASETVTLVVVPDKSEARYRVREQLAGVSLPSDAVGKTNAITGQIVGKLDGTIVSEQSEFVVDVRTLQSDSGIRDGFIQRTPLETSRYPTVKFVPTSAVGLPLTPTAEPVSFQLVGDLTIRDVTKPVTWEVTCQMDGSQTQGTCSAKTTFTFADFQLEQPRVARVLSIEDNITLEVDLVLQRANP